MVIKGTFFVRPRMAQPYKLYKHSIARITYGVLAEAIYLAIVLTTNLRPA